MYRYDGSDLGVTAPGNPFRGIGIPKASDVKNIFLLALIIDA